MTTTTKEIGLWLDETSDAEWTAWVVSVDDVGEPSCTNAIAWWRLDQHEDAYRLARQRAEQEARKRGLPLVLTDEFGNRRTIDLD